MPILRYPYLIRKPLFLFWLLSRRILYIYFWCQNLLIIQIVNDFTDIRIILMVLGLHPLLFHIHNSHPLLFCYDWFGGMHMAYSIETLVHYEICIYLIRYFIVFREIRFLQIGTSLNLRVLLVHFTCPLCLNLCMSTVSWLVVINSCFFLLLSFSHILAACVPHWFVLAACEPLLIDSCRLCAAESHLYIYLTIYKKIHLSIS
jgi:hypothetical protein